MFLRFAHHTGCRSTVYASADGTVDTSLLDEFGASYVGAISAVACAQLFDSDVELLDTILWDTFAAELDR